MEEKFGFEIEAFSIFSEVSAVNFSPNKPLTYFATSCSPKPRPPHPSPRFDHLAFCASLRHRAQRPQETLSTFLNAPLLSMPSSQVWDTAPPRPQQGTKHLRARFGLISGIGPAGLNQDLALNLFQEILLKFPPILPTQCSHGKKEGAFFLPAATSCLGNI